MTIPSPKVSSRPSSTAPNSLIASSRTTRPVPSAPSSFPGTTTSTTTPELGCSPPPPSITPWLTPSSPNASKPCTPLAPHTPSVSSTVYPNRNRYHTSSGSTRPTIPRQSLDPKWKSSPKLHRAIVPMLLTRSGGRSRGERYGRQRRDAVVYQGSTKSPAGQKATPGRLCRAHFLGSGSFELGV